MGVMSLLEHKITSTEPYGDGLTCWTCACGTWGTCVPMLVEQITAEHLAADDSVGPMGVHAANVRASAGQQASGRS